MRGPVDLLDAASLHQLTLQAEGRSPATQRLYLLYQRRFIEFLEVRHIAPRLEALNPLNARQAVLWFQQRGRGARDGAVATAMFLNVLKTWAGFLEREGVWSDSPLRRVRRVRVRKVERQPYTRAEVGAMLEACDRSRSPERDRLMVLLLLESGARIAEITGLRVDDVRFETRTIRVLGKGNRERTIPVGTAHQPDGGPLFRAYRTYLKARELQVARAPERAADRLFLTKAGYPLTPEGGGKVIRRLGEAAGVENAMAHRYRHLFATVYLTQYPGDEMGLRRILGHISSEVLREYVHLADATIAQRQGRVAPTTAWLNGTAS